MPVGRGEVIRRDGFKLGRPGKITVGKISLKSIVFYFARGIRPKAYLNITKFCSIINYNIIILS